MVKICDRCINCGMCYNTCPFGAIEKAGTTWTDNEGKIHPPLSKDHFFINPSKCRRCLRCVDVCPIRNIDEECDDSCCDNKAVVSSVTSNNDDDDIDDDLI